jgi:hypothetical protein
VKKLSPKVFSWELRKNILTFLLSCKIYCLSFGQIIGKTGNSNRRGGEKTRKEGGKFKRDLEKGMVPLKEKRQSLIHSSGKVWTYQQD